MIPKVLWNVTLLLLTVFVAGLEANQEQNVTSASPKKQNTGPGSSSVSAKKPKSPLAQNVVIGGNTFAEVIKSSAFVDKTMLIKDFVYSPCSIIVITCPKKFGKSTSVNMIKTFLEMQLDKDGKEVTDVKGTQNYKLFMQGNRFKICNETDFVTNNLGKWPVIYIDLSSVHTSNTYETLLAAVKDRLHETFMRHAYLAKSSNLTQDQLELFGKYIHNEKYKRLNNDAVRNGIAFLSRLLRTHFGKRAYVLMDEFDAAVHSAILSGFDVDKSYSITNGMFRYVLRGNEANLEGALITGVSGILRAARSSPLSEFSTYEFLGKHSFAKYVGFTDKEVRKLLSDFKIEDEETRKQIDSWYGGYVVKDRNLPIYNPWSLLMYLKNGEFDSYWLKCGTIDRILDILNLDKNRRKIQWCSAIQEENKFAFDLRTTVEKDNLKDLQKVLQVEFSDEVTPNDYYLWFFSYMFELGCLTYTNEKIPFKMPNREITAAIKELLTPR